MSASFRLLVLPVLVAAGASPPKPTSDYDVVDPPDVSTEDEDLAMRIEAGQRACGVWRADLGGGRTAVLAAFCSKAENPAVPVVARWTLSVVRTDDPARRLARTILESRYEQFTGCGARGLLRVRRDVLPDEPVLEVGWGCRSEGDGVFPAVELWRLGAKGLTRIFTMPSSTGLEPSGTAHAVSWRPGPAEGRPASIEVSWSYHASRAGEPAWAGEQRLLHRFDSTTFRPPPGALLHASAYASAWVPPSSVADYAPPRALDDSAGTAWCAPSQPPPSLSVLLAEPTRVRALQIVPGYARNEATFRDNARIARVRIDAGGTTDGPVSFEASLADTMRSQEITFPPGAGSVGSIQVTAVAVHPGRKHQDVCISDFRIVPGPAARP